MQELNFKIAVPPFEVASVFNERRRNTQNNAP
jgi:hypothetical protein